MSMIHAIPRRLQALVVAVTLALLGGMSLLLPGIAHAGQIYCGQSPRINFWNDTSPSSYIWIDNPVLCQPYSSILTVSGDHVYLDGGGTGSSGAIGGYMRMSPRVACDISVDQQPYTTYRNYSYTQNSEAILGLDSYGNMHWKYTVFLCNTF
jgi:hypothetical protein